MLTQDEIQEGIGRLSPWFHKIDLGFGLTTKTQAQVGEHDDNPEPTWAKLNHLWPEDLTGQSVLDVGCNAGFYAVAAKRRGASRVLGIDAQRHHVTQANFVRRALGLEIEFRQMSVYDLDPRELGRFDITLALGLLYHCKHIVLAVEKLAHITNRTLFIETAVYPPEHQPWPFQHRIAGDGCDIHTFGYVENPSHAREAVYNWFLPSVEGLRALLQNVGFGAVQVADVANSRAILVAHRQGDYPDSRTLGPMESLLTLDAGPAVCQVGTPLALQIAAKNTGFVKWLAGEYEGSLGSVSLGTHLLRPDGTEITWEYGRRGYLERDLLPGETAHFSLNLIAPDAPGQYVLEIDLVAESVAWFEDLGNIPLRHEITVTV